ncbi:hypothetical protein [Thermoleptolyngbya sp.]
MTGRDFALEQGAIALNDLRIVSASSTNLQQICTWQSIPRSNP